MFRQVGANGRIWKMGERRPQEPEFSKWEDRNGKIYRMIAQGLAFNFEVNTEPP